MTSHRLSYDPLYNVWRGMMRRCNDTKSISYKNYGGRGISVCSEWHDVKVFYKWAKDKYAKGLYIDRINNDGNYEPSNCQFITPMNSNQIHKKRIRKDTSIATGVPNITMTKHGTFKVGITKMGVLLRGSSKTLDGAIQLLNRFKYELSLKRF